MIGLRKSRRPDRGVVPVRRRVLAAMAAAAWPWRPGIAVDDNRYPNRPIRLILPSTAGGSSDLLARMILPYMVEALGAPVVIDLRPGAAGRIAVDVAADAAPDGYALLMANNATSTLAPDPHGGAAQDPLKAFAPVTRLVRVPILVAASPGLGVSTLAELIDRARAMPGKLSYASGGIGSTSHLAASLLWKRAGVTLLHVPYAGTSAGVRDVLGGIVPVLFTHPGTVAPLVRDGRLRALAVSGRRRLPEYPGIETVAEAGYKGFDVTTWQGIVAPAGTPRAIVMRLHDELARIIALPEVRRQLAALGMEADAGTPEQFATDIAAEARQWAEVTRSLGGPPE